MNVTLKPFDFASAVARAGLGVDGQPIGGIRTPAAPAVDKAGFQNALGNALKGVS